MKESYCDLCENCQIDKPDFLEAIGKVKKYLGQLPMYLWAHCFPGDTGFSLDELLKGLEWFLRHPECPSCKGGGALKDCPIRLCTMTWEVAHCLQCPDLKTCDHYNMIIQKSPENVDYLHRFLIRNNFCDP